MLQDYKLEIGFDNCLYDSPYLVEGCANSCITLIIDSEKFPTLQSKKNVQEELQNVIKAELAKIKWIIYNDVNLEFFWYFSCLRKIESDKIEELENLIHPLIYTYLSCNLLYIDDIQILSINSLWISRYVRSSRITNLKFSILFNNNDCYIK